MLVGAVCGTVAFLAAVPIPRAEAQGGEGCCSYHGGVLGCAGTKVVCNDGQVSTSCTCNAPTRSPVTWTLSVNDGIIPRTGLFSRAGSSVPAPIGWRCAQAAPQQRSLAVGGRVETVSVSCTGTFGTEVSLVTGCSMTQADSNSAMMAVKDSLANATFTLACSTGP